jgi:DNA-binding NtrC family response regulator
MRALASAKDNVTAAAKKLGISRRTLHRKINEMNAAKTEAEMSALDISPERHIHLGGQR